jgi:hypothetical protein
MNNKYFGIAVTGMFVVGLLSMLLYSQRYEVVRIALSPGSPLVWAYQSYANWASPESTVIWMRYFTARERSEMLICEAYLRMLEREDASYAKTALTVGIYERLGLIFGLASERWSKDNYTIDTDSMPNQ